MAWLHPVAAHVTGSAARALEAARHQLGRWPRVPLCLFALLCAALQPVFAATHAADARNATLTVGRLTLHRCATPARWCGTLQRPLDPSGSISGSVPIYFEYYPHSGAGPAVGTVVPAEGGPGYPSTESRAAYLTMYAPLRATHDVLIMDYRGTGRSQAIDCRLLQNAARLTEADIGACGEQLGRRGPLYGSALASDDLAALVKALAVARIDLYGDSYGSYFAQVFALRHATLVHSLVLDGADALEGPDLPWYPNYAAATREKFNLACRRDAACSAQPGDSLAHIAPALAGLRARPFAAQASYGAGSTLRFTADASALAAVMFTASPALASVRELDAAARAFSAGDQAPLLRLMAETLSSVDSRDPSHSPEKFSAGLAAAVSCLDPPQIFDMLLPPAQRLLQRDQLMAARERAKPDAYAPFSFAEYRAMPLDYTFIDQCVRWPAVAAPLIVPSHPYPDLPVLVISGELDNMTPVADGVLTASHFSHAHHVIIANSFHVNALPGARSDCAALLVRHFIETLEVGDEGCAAAVPPVHLVPRFATTVRELDAAHALPENRADGAALRAVNAALLTCEDVISRAMQNGAGEGIGLRGGSFTASARGEGYQLLLREVRWTQDLAVSGRIDWPGRTGMVRARLKLQAAVTGHLTLSWPEGAEAARAAAHGLLNGAAVAADAPAP